MLRDVLVFISGFLVVTSGLGARESYKNLAAEDLGSALQRNAVQKGQAMASAPQTTIWQGGQSGQTPHPPVAPPLSPSFQPGPSGPTKRRGAPSLTDAIKGLRKSDPRAKPSGQSDPSSIAAAAAGKGRDGLRKTPKKTPAEADEAEGKGRFNFRSLPKAGSEKKRSSAQAGGGTPTAIPGSPNTDAFDGAGPSSPGGSGTPGTPPLQTPSAGRELPFSQQASDWFVGEFSQDNTISQVRAENLGRALAEHMLTNDAVNGSMSGSPCYHLYGQAHVQKLVDGLLFSVKVDGEGSAWDIVQKMIDGILGRLNAEPQLSGKPLKASDLSPPNLPRKNLCCLQSMYASSH